MLWSLVLECERIIFLEVGSQFELNIAELLSNIFGVEIVYEGF